MIQQQEAAETLVAHANVASGELVIWLESSSGLLQRNEGPPVDEAPHPFALSGEDAARRLSAARIDVGEGVTAVAMVALPRSDRGVAPSAPLARVFGRAVEDFGEPSGLGPVRVEGWAPEASRWAEALDALLESEGAAGYRLICAPSVAFFARAAMFGLHLLAQQRFVPMLYQDASGHLSGAWAPWLSDSTTAGQVASFVKSMPPSARAAIDECDHDAWRMFDSFVSKQVDAIGRRALAAEDMHEVVEDLDTDADAQVAWASSLLTSEREIKAPAPTRTEIARRVRRWIGVLEERGKSSAWRLLLRLNEPIITGEAQADGEAAGDASAQTTAIDLADAQPDAAEWSISFHLQSVEHEDIVVDAADVWMLSREAVSIQGLSLEAPQELLLGELARAARVYKKLEGVLDDNEPIEMILETEQAYAFLREQRPLLIEQGFGVESPGWWSSPAGRLGVRLKIDSDPVEAMMDPQSGGAAASGAQLGLSALVGYHWEIAIGDTTLTLHEFEKLASKGSPLVRVNGRWVEIRPEDVQAAIKFIGTNPGGEMKLAEAMRLAYASDARETGLPVLGLEATGWVASIFGETPGLSSPGAGMGDSNTEVPTLETPSGFRGTLRPYQLRGLSWLAFLERVGFGACLADDMGLGKTIQLLALLARDRDAAEEAGTKMPPTLLVAPMSVIGNWLREAKRFTPDLKVLLHHGAERAQGDELIASVMAHDMVVTTYALAHRDAETLSLAPWARVVLDEAQFIKNPAAKQSVAVRSFTADRRIALTGTPVENRLSELWSIMDFLNPGYLGSPGNFRKRFSVPIERYRDQHRSRQLRGLVRPFVLRRVKTDPTVVADLPEKLETKEYTHLTTEQAQLYENCVKRMLSEVEQTEGIHRRGIVLAALIRLKQICNHPSQVLGDHHGLTGSSPDPSRSGKCTRLMEMVSEVLAEGERTLIFTQFRQMGHILASMLRHQLGEEVLFLHGGTSKTAREQMVDQFQDPKSGKPILLLSLKAGGVGLNLTAATHVFHFDRWWNPAVENQATDRAYRIGQTRTVHVHKFVVRGTLEERIDEMIESKTELAENIIGQGERWLTELDMDQLKDILALRADAIGDEE